MLFVQHAVEQDDPRFEFLGRALGTKGSVSQRQFRLARPPGEHLALARGWIGGAIKVQPGDGLASDPIRPHQVQKRVLDPDMQCLLQFGDEVTCRRLVNECFRGS